jgi:hypothetical protein
MATRRAQTIGVAVVMCQDGAAGDAHRALCDASEGGRALSVLVPLPAGGVHAGHQS